MIIVHDTFVCKPGNAGNSAKIFKEMMAGSKHMVNVMTDMTGQYHRVVMVSQYESLADYEKAQQEYMNPSEEMKKSMEKMKDFNEMYTTGSREIFKVW
jgi:quinol monooxygenase YgiN